MQERRRLAMRRHYGQRRIAWGTHYHTHYDRGFNRNWHIATLAKRLAYPLPRSTWEYVIGRKW